MTVNNIDGIRMSTAITYLEMARHRLNLTIRGNSFVKKILIKDSKAYGVEVETFGENLILPPLVCSITEPTIFSKILLSALL